MGTNGHTIIPEHESHCVWMDAGLVNYKLCTCGFECDACPFDAVMRAQHRTFAQRASADARWAAHTPAAAHSEPVVPSTPAPLPAEPNPSSVPETIIRLLEPFHAIRTPQDRVYFRSHTWMKTMDDGTVRIGIDEFIARLLAPVSAVALVYVPSHVRQGQPFAWCIRNDATVALHADVSGLTISSNPLLASRPSLLTSDPYGAGWLLSLSAPDEQEHTSLTPAQYDTVRQEEVERLTQYVRSSVRPSSVPNTMNDGGQWIDSIEQFIGEKRYRRYLSGLIGPH